MLVLGGALAGVAGFAVGWWTSRALRADPDADVIAAGDALARCLRAMTEVSVVRSIARPLDGEVLLVGGETWQRRMGQALAMWEGLNEERSRRV